jgi:CRISPR type III-A-associated protein Csm2
MAYTILQVLNEIKGLKAMSDLPAERYAEENGLADSFVQGLRGDLKPTQLRKVFHQIKDMRHQFKHEKFERAKVAMVMPTLAYSAGRKLIPGDFYELMKLCFGQERCKTDKDFEAATDFLEAIMAYHKYHDGLKK